MEKYIDCGHIKTREQAATFMDNLWDSLTPIWENPTTRANYSMYYSRVMATKKYLMAKGFIIEETEDIFA